MTAISEGAVPRTGDGVVAAALSAPVVSKRTLARATVEVVAAALSVLIATAVGVAHHHSKAAGTTTTAPITHKAPRVQAGRTGGAVHLRASHRVLTDSDGRVGASIRHSAQSARSGVQFLRRVTKPASGPHHNTPSSPGGPRHTQAVAPPGPHHATPGSRIGLWNNHWFSAPNEPVRKPAPAVKAAPAPASLPTTYAARSTGFDISKYQCADIPATRSAVAVVQVTGGGINKPPNPCYAKEAAWAGRNLSVYIYMDGLTRPDPVESRVEASRCNPKHPLCQDYDYGYFWASHWVAYSHKLGIYPKLWWLDVENGTSWTNPVKDFGAIRGAADALHAQGVVVGLYSTPSQWATIAGSYKLPGVQIWTAGAGRITGPGRTATTVCKSKGYNFAGGHLKMVQYGYTGSFLGAAPKVAPYDYDYVCN